MYGKRHILEIEVRSNFYAAYLIQITSNMIHPIYSDRRREDIGGKEGGRQWAAPRLCASASKFGGDVSNTGLEMGAAGHPPAAHCLLLGHNL